MRPCALGGNENAGNWSAGIAFDIYQKYRIDLKYNGYFGDYAPTTTGARDMSSERLGCGALRSRLGVAHVQDYILMRITIMFRKTLLAAGIAAFASAGAFAAVSPDEAKQLGTTLTPVGAEKAGNKDGTIPGVHRWTHRAAGDYQKGSKVPYGSVR